MVSIGGPEVMVLGALVSGAVLLALGLVLRRSLGTFTAVVGCALAWSVIVIGLVTLVPAYGSPGYIPVEEAQTVCSRDFGGPAPEGFWIFSGGQRLLNTALFVPAGFLLALLVSRWRFGWLVLLPGLAALAAYSVGIEWLQLEATRIDRACDVTDIFDNTVGAVFGGLVGIVVGIVLRPRRP